MNWTLTLIFFQNILICHLKNLKYKTLISFPFYYYCCMKIELSTTLFFSNSRILCGKPNQTKFERFYHCATIKITEVSSFSIMDANSHLLTHICAGVSIQTRLKIAEKWSKILENVSKKLWPKEKKTFTNYGATSSCVDSLKRWKPNQLMKEVK